MFVWWFSALAMVIAVSMFLSRRGSFWREKTALDILKERYAKGEITEQDFENMKRDLAVPFSDVLP